MNISKICFFAGLLSIPLSVGIWFLSPCISTNAFDLMQDVNLRKVLVEAHAERWGIFVGLWPATLLILSDVLSRSGK